MLAVCLPHLHFMFLFLSSFSFLLFTSFLFFYIPVWLQQISTACHSQKPNNRQRSYKTKCNKAHIKINKAKNIINSNSTRLKTSQCITPLTGYHIMDLAISFCLAIFYTFLLINKSYEKTKTSHELILLTSICLYIQSLIYLIPLCYRALLLSKLLKAHQWGTLFIQHHEHTHCGLFYLTCCH